VLSKYVIHASASQGRDIHTGELGGRRVSADLRKESHLWPEVILKAMSKVRGLWYVR
jgi:hypothetical protein